MVRGGIAVLAILIGSATGVMAQGQTVKAAPESVRCVVPGNAGRAGGLRA